MGLCAAGAWESEYTNIPYWSSEWFWVERPHTWPYDRNDPSPTLTDLMYVQAFSTAVPQILQMCSIDKKRKKKAEMCVFVHMCGRFWNMGKGNRRAQWRKRRSWYYISTFSNRIWQTACDAEICQISLPGLTLCVSCLKFLFDSSLGRRGSH